MKLKKVKRDIIESIKVQNSQKVNEEFDLETKVQAVAPVAFVDALAKSQKLKKAIEDRMKEANKRRKELEKDTVERKQNKTPSSDILKKMKLAEDFLTKSFKDGFTKDKNIYKVEKLQREDLIKLMENARVNKIRYTIHKVNEAYEFSYIFEEDNKKKVNKKDMKESKKLKENDELSHELRIKEWAQSKIDEFGIKPAIKKLNIIIKDFKEDAIEMGLKEHELKKAISMVRGYIQNAADDADETFYALVFMPINDDVEEVEQYEDLDDAIDAFHEITDKEGADYQYVILQRVVIKDGIEDIDIMGEFREGELLTGLEKSKKLKESSSSSFAKKLFKKYGDWGSACNAVQDTAEEVLTPKEFNKYLLLSSLDSKKTEGSDGILFNGTYYDWKEFDYKGVQIIASFLNYFSTSQLKLIEDAMKKSLGESKKLKEAYSDMASAAMKDGTQVMASATTSSTRTYNYEHIAFRWKGGIGKGKYRYQNRSWQRFDFASALEDAMIAAGVEKAFAKEVIEKTYSFDKAIKYFADNYKDDMKESKKLKEGLSWGDIAEINALAYDLVDEFGGLENAIDNVELVEKARATLKAFGYTGQDLEDAINAVQISIQYLYNDEGLNELNESKKLRESNFDSEDEDIKRYKDLSYEKLSSLGQKMKLKDALDLWWNSIRIDNNILYKKYDGSGYELDELDKSDLDREIILDDNADEDSDGFPIIYAKWVDMKESKKLKEDKALQTSKYKDLIGKHFNHTMEFDFLDLIAKTLDRIDFDIEDDEEFEDEVRSAISDILTYRESEWLIAKFYTSSPRDLDWDNVEDDFVDDIMSLATQIKY